VTEWSTVASLATAGGTLVLAVATFASIRSANRSARISERAARTAERSLLGAQRPLLVASRLQDPRQQIQYPEGMLLTVEGGMAALEFTDGVAPDDNGLWLGALRDPAAGIFRTVTDAIKAGEPLVINLLYGDFEGGQRVISQFSLRQRGRALADAGDAAFQRGPARSSLGVKGSLTDDHRRRVAQADVHWPSRMIVRPVISGRLFHACMARGVAIR
jgi:hypothetical protein